MAKDELTAKQARFCEYYCNPNCNGTQAAILAGYSPKTAKQIADQNLKKPAVIKRIEEGREKTLNAIGLTKEAAEEEIMQFLTGVMRGTIMEKYVVVTDKRGRQHFEKVHPTVHERLMAADKLARYLGMYKSGVTVNCGDTVIFIDNLDI